jgi:hypothetical protein
VIGNSRFNLRESIYQNFRNDSSSRSARAISSQIKEIHSTPNL